MKSLRLGLTQICVGIVTLCLAGTVSAQQATPTPKRGGTVVWVIASEPSVINPVTTTATPETNVSCNLFEGLVVLNVKTNKFEPLLAESWTISPDGKTYTFKLRKTNWHDGRPFTSEDVRYTVADVMVKVGPLFAAQVGKLVEAVETPDLQTAVIRLKEAYGPLLLTLTCAFNGAMIPSHLFKDTDVRANPVNQKPVGTGPFKFQDWARGDHITLVRNENYWDAGKPYLDSVVMKIIPNGASRTQALLAGEVDYIPFTAFPINDGKLIDTNPKTKREATGLPSSQLFGFFNLKRKPLDDVRVRHALLTATDRNYIRDNAFFGLGRPGQSPWATLIEWAHDPAINYDESHPFNPEKAGQMLEEAGYKADASGIRFSINIVYDAARPEQNQTASALKAMWRRAGVDLQLVALEAAVLLPRVHKDSNFDFHISAYSSYADPAIGIGRSYISSTIGGNFGNAASYSNSEVDALFNKASALTTLEERGAVYKQIEVILMRDLPAIMVHENVGLDAANKKLVGGWGWSGNLRAGNAWLEP